MVLLTNDDGYFSEGINILSRKLQTLGEIYIVAPDRERSASSLSLSLHKPLRVKSAGEKTFAVSGTPADCVYMAIQKLLPRKPDLLISGINHGPNLGQQDISYSGTVAGALQGTFLEIPSLAVSAISHPQEGFDFEFSADLIEKAAAYLLSNRWFSGVTLNINIPPPPIKGIKVTKLGQKRYNPEIISKSDPRDRTYYWIGTGNPQAIGDDESDVMVVKEGYVSITPLQKDLTAHKVIESTELHSLLGTVTK